MIERLLVYKNNWESYPAKIEVQIVDFDRNKLKYSVVKEISFDHYNKKTVKYVGLLKDKLKTIADAEKCKKIVGDNEFRVSYLLESYHENNKKK